MGATSAVQICNNALLRLGTNTISSLTDGTTAANACNQSYEPTRDSLLRRHFWNFATTRASLASDAVAPSFGYATQFTLPTDYVRTRGIDQQVYTYKIEGTKLLTDATAPLNLIYIARLTDVTKYDPLFVDALILALVIKIGPRILGNGFNPATYAEEFSQTLLAAQIADSQDVSPTNMQIDTFIEGRYGFNSDIWSSMGN